MQEAIRSFLTRINPNYRLILFLLLTLMIIISSAKFYDYKTEDFRNRVFTKVVDDALNETQLLLEGKKNSSLAVALSLSQDNLLPDIIFGKPYVSMQLETISEKLKNNTPYKNLWFSIIDSQGNSIQQNLEFLNNKKSYYLYYTKQMSQDKKPISFYDVNEYGLTISSLAPILFEKDFIGMFAVISNLNSVAQKLQDDGFRTVIFLDDVQSKKIDIKHSLSKKFIGENYVVNYNANDVAIKLITNRGVDYYINLKEPYVVHDATNSLETVYKLKNADDKQPLGYIVLMKNLDDIDMGNLELNQNAHMGFTVFIIVVLGLLIYYRHSYKHVKQMEVENEKLLLLNTTLNDKNDELDFNEKKIANMFHVQPNFMVLSDGQSIENVNERMLWLLTGNNGETIDDIRKKYKDISELFEESDDKSIDLTDYIISDYIDGVPWKDYVLTNFKRHYKTCMRDKYGNQHHFTIKMNEMKYAKYIKRYIIITFIDITNELKLIKKTQEQQRRIMEQTKMFEMEELVSFISDQWKPQVNAISLVANDIKFKQDTDILKDKDISLCTKDVVSKTNVLFDTIDTFVKFIQEKSQAHRVDISDTIELSLKMMGDRCQEKGVCIVKHLSDEKMYKTMIAGELSQVLIYIFEFAKHQFKSLKQENKWFDIKLFKEDNFAVITLEDNTGGIEPSKIDNIFKQNPNDKGELAQTGLYMSKMLIEKNLRGTLNVENTEHGAKFTIKLELDKTIEFKDTDIGV